MGEQHDELAVIEPQAPLALFGTTDPIEVIRVASGVATELAKVVNAQKLYAIVNGKKFPTVEAWTLLGSMLGVFPITEWVHELHNEDGSVRGFEARVEARTLAGRLVGAGEARCIRGESKTWHLRAEEYAVSSMAQTRATSKALRGPLDFVFKLAGFQPTPAEEMPTGEIPSSEATPESQTALQEARDSDQRQSGAQAHPPLTAIQDSAAAVNPLPPTTPKSGPRAKRGNVVAAPQAAGTVSVESAGSTRATPAQGRSGVQEAGSQIPTAAVPPATVALDEGEEVYRAELRHQARAGAAVLRQLRIRMNNAEAARNGQPTQPESPATPNEDSDESLALFVASKFPGMTLNTLAEKELEAVTTQIDTLIEKVQAQVK